MQDFVCALQEWSLCFPQSCGSPIIKSCWTSKSDSLGIPSSFVESPCWEAWHGAQNLHNTLVLLFSNLWVAQPGGGVVWDLILSWLRPSYCLAAAFSLSLDMGYFFFFLVGSSVLLYMVVQQLVAILVLLQEEMSIHPSTLPSWTRSQDAFYFYYLTLHWSNYPKQSENEKQMRCTKLEKYRTIQQGVRT